MSHADLQTFIDVAWEHRATTITAVNAPEMREKVERVISELNAGRLRVAERQGVGQWTVNQWVKKAVLLSFRLNDNKHDARRRPELLRQGADQVRPRLDEEAMRARPACAWCRRRWRGAAATSPENVVLMPSYVNIGAYVDEATMVDTWATVGSCAQIGKNVHLSGGVGIGGVLEPLQANPTIIEDNCFIGARSRWSKA